MAWHMLCIQVVNTTEEGQTMNKREIKAWLKDETAHMEPTEDMDGNKILSVYLGSFLSLDPCGRYHHAISPNGISSKCERFWENLETVASDLGGWIESGEGDPLDTFFCMNADEETEEVDQ